MMRIGFFQTAFLGDLLLSVPTLKQIKRWQPESVLVLYCRKGLGPFMEALPFVDQAIEVDKKDSESRRHFVSQISKERLDYLFCAHQSFRSHMWVRKISATTKVGFSRWWNALFFDIRLARPHGKHDVLRQLSLLSPVSPTIKDILKTPETFLQSEEIPSEISMSLPKSFWEKTNVSELPLPDKDFICLSPGSVWNTKRWVPEGFAKVASHYLERGWDVFFLGAPNEAALCESLAQKTGGHSLAGKLSLWQVAQFVSRSQLMVTNDSGAQHIASLAGTPTVSVFGPTVLSLGYRPWQNQARVVEVDLDCRPCGKHGHIRCPLGTHECMKAVPAETVIASAENLLEGSETSS